AGREALALNVARLQYPSHVRSSGIRGRSQRGRWNRSTRTIGRPSYAIRAASGVLGKVDFGAGTSAHRLTVSPALKPALMWSLIECSKVGTSHLPSRSMNHAPQPKTDRRIGCIDETTMLPAGLVTRANSL